LTLSRTFWELASGWGANPIRLTRVDAATRAEVLARVRSGLDRLARQDFLVRPGESGGCHVCELPLILPDFSALE